MKSIFFLYLVAGVASTVLELNTGAHGFFFLSYRLVGDSESDAPSTAPLMILPDVVLCQGEEQVLEFLNITSIDNEHIITRSFLQRPDSIGEVMIPAHQRFPIIPAGFDSAFATQFARTYMMIPLNRQLIINPVNPEEFVYNGLLTTTNSTNVDYPQVRISVSILISTQEEDGSHIPPATIGSTGIHHFAIRTLLREDSVPESIITTFVEHLRRRQIRVDTGFRSDRILRIFDTVGLTDEDIDTFPIIQYRIHTDSGADAVIQLHGKDYIGPLVNQRRELSIREGDRLSLGLNTLSKIALFVDNANRIIGFGEPL